MRFDILRNSDGSLFLVDCLIKPLTVEAGWVWFAPGLTSVEVIYPPGEADQQFPIQISEVLRDVRTPSDTSFPSEPVEFLRQLDEA